MKDKSIPPATSIRTAVESASPVATVDSVIATSSPVAATLESSPAIDSESEKSFDELARETLIAGLEDITKSSRAALDNFANYYLPLMARQSAMLGSDNADERDRAKKNLRALNAQALISAASFGIDLQQRHELQVLTLLRSLIRIGVKAIL